MRKRPAEIVLCVTLAIVILLSAAGCVDSGGYPLDINAQPTGAPLQVGISGNGTYFITSANITMVSGGSGNVTAVTATAPTTSTGGATPDIGLNYDGTLQVVGGVLGVVPPVETDPVYSGDPASTITTNNITDWNDKQEALVSGVNIKTINSSTILGAGDLVVTGSVSENLTLKTLYVSENSTFGGTINGTSNITTTGNVTAANLLVSLWNLAYGWGNHALVGYLTNITSQNVTDALGYTPADNTTFIAHTNDTNVHLVGGNAPTSNYSIYSGEATTSNSTTSAATAGYATYSGQSTSSNSTATSDYSTYSGQATSSNTTANDSHSHASNNITGGTANQIIKWVGTAASWYSVLASDITTWLGYVPADNVTAFAHYNNTSNPHSTSDVNIVTSNVTDNNATASKHGFLPLLSGSATEFLNGLGNWISLTASHITTALGFTPVSNTTTVNGLALSANITIVSVQHSTYSGQATSANSSSTSSYTTYAGTSTSSNATGAGDLTGATLAPGVTASSLTSFGTNATMTTPQFRISLTAGENIAAFDAVYVASDGKIYKASANTTATMPGIFIAPTAINNGASGAVVSYGFITNTSWAFTPGAMLYVGSGIAGVISATAPSASGYTVQAIGIAITATMIEWNPSLVQIVLN